MDNDILAQAEEILGKAVKVEAHRSWAIFWCPFHNDSARAGNGGHANFGVHLVKGYWVCLRCGEKGGSLNSLRKKLGQDWKPADTLVAVTRYDSHPSQVNFLDEALAETRAGLQRSPAWQYLAERGLRPYTTLVYGLGYGLPKPMVSCDTLKAARQSRLVIPDGTWLWSGGVIYADPPIQPTVINVRYIAEDKLPPGTRPLVPEQNHRTWGNRTRPLGSWRITANTRLVVVVEGLFDMLILAQALHDRGLEREVVPVYTNGACHAARMLEWFSQNPQYEYLLIRDPDEAGTQWARAVGKMIRHGGGKVRAAKTPDQLDPDEAILSGWWPSGI